jgi:hypothetical protein
MAKQIQELSESARVFQGDAGTDVISLDLDEDANAVGASCLSPLHPERDSQRSGYP